MCKMYVEVPTTYIEMLKSVYNCNAIKNTCHQVELIF